MNYQPFFIRLWTFLLFCAKISQKDDFGTKNRHEEVAVGDEVFPSNIEQLLSGLNLLSRYFAQLDEKLLDPSITELVDHLQVFTRQLQEIEEQRKQQTNDLLNTQQKVDLERQRYQDLFSFAPNGYLVTDPKGVILEANHQAAAILNTHHQFLINMPFSVYVLRADWRKFLELLRLCQRTVIEKGAIETSSICFQDQELKLKPIQLDPIITLVSAAVADEDEQVVLRWSIRDITSQRMAQEALSESEMKFRNLAETTAGAILIVQEGKILYANQAVCKMLGYPIQRLMDRPFPDILHPADWWAFDQWTQRVNHDFLKLQATVDANTFRKEARLLTVEGRECWVDLSAGKLLSNDKLAWVITAFDISARVRSERARTELLHRLVSAQEEERRRISRELHDQVGQMISAINLGLKSLDGSLPNGSQEKLANLRGLINDLSLGIQRMALDLRPSALDDLGLPVALTDYLEGWSQRSRIRVDFQSNIPKNLSMPSDVKIAIYRIIQEALNNIQKHAEANIVSLILDQHSQQLIVVVEDDGLGFDIDGFINSPQARQHLGLIGMKERAELIGGRLDIESTPGKGTSIIIRVPIVENTGSEESDGKDQSIAGR